MKSAEKTLNMTTMKFLNGLKIGGNKAYKINKGVGFVKKDDFPITLTAQHVAEILGISLIKAYDLMESESFPLIRVGRHKKVNREAFFNWLTKEQRVDNTYEIKIEINEYISLLITADKDYTSKMNYAELKQLIADKLQDS